MWLNKWKIRVNTEKSTHVTLALHRGYCPNVSPNNCLILQNDNAKYLGLHINRRLMCKHILRLKNNI